MATSAEALTRLQAQTLIATVIGGATVTGATWSAGSATVTIGAHTLVIGQTVVVTGISPAGFNGTFVLTAVAATTITYVVADPGSSYSAGGKVTAQVRLGLQEMYAAQNFFYNIGQTLSANTGPACVILPARNGPWDGQKRSFPILIDFNLWFGAAANTSIDMTSFEDTWVGIRNALGLKGNWTNGSHAMDECIIITPEARTDQPAPGVNIWLYVFQMTFWGAMPSA